MKKLKMKFAALMMTVVALMSFAGAAGATSVSETTTIPSYSTSMDTAVGSFYVPDKVSVAVYQDSYNVKVRLDNRFGGGAVSYHVYLERSSSGSWIAADNLGSSLSINEVNLITFDNIAVRGTEMRARIVFTGYSTGYLYFTR